MEVRWWMQGLDRPDAPAITWRGETVTYGELRRRVGRAIHWIRSRGLGPSDVLAIQLPKSLAFLELHLAALATGVITLPLNDRYTEAEVEWMLADAEVHTAIRPADRATLGRELATAAVDPIPDPPDPECIGVLCYTSGTTGRPKGARIRQRNIAACVEALHQAWRWRSDDILVHALPLFHVHGLFVAQHGALRAGAHAVWLEKFRADEVFRAIERHRATIFMGVPTFYHRLLKEGPEGRDLDSVRLFTSGSAGLPASDWRAWKERTGHEIVERYGMTEIGIVLSNPLDGPRKPGSIGVPLPGVQARVVEGELQIRGPSVFAGYLNRPEATAEALVDGWMRTGDLAEMDVDGFVRLNGRRSELILRGGLNVYPPEVEAVLLGAPAVSEAAVFGLPDPDLGERVGAAVVLERAAEPQEILEHARGRLARFKVPERLWILDELPRNAMGKVTKADLRALAATS